MKPQLRIGMVLFPGFTQLDLTAPHEVLARLPRTEVTLLAKEAGPVRSENGMVISAESTFEGSSPFDVLFVPGGPGIADAMEDDVTRKFVGTQGRSARYVTSVCTGSLLLGAAGLLSGYRATSHWLSLEFLRLFGAVPVQERVVQDRNRITGAGVTSGIDFALALARELLGPETAQKIQLTLEYHPSPEFPEAGSPLTAEPSRVAEVRAERRAIQEDRRMRFTALAQRLRDENAIGPSDIPLEG